MRSTRTLTRLVCALCLLAALPAHAIIGGMAPDSPTARVDPNAATSPFAGVGSISVGNNTYTGTLIGHDAVLTAAHVVVGQAPAAVTFNLNVGGDLNYRLQASQIIVNPNYQGFTPGADGIVHNDLAIIRLASPAPSDVPVYAIDGNPLSLYTRLTFVGYGAGGSGDVGATINASPTVKRVGANRVEMLASPAAGQSQPDAYLFRFDAPSDPASLGNAVEATLGSGDSGSPALIQDASGQWKLAAVNTFVANLAASQQAKGTFGTGGGGVLLAAPATSAWISSVVAPVPEPTSGVLMLSGIALMGARQAVRRVRRLK